MPIGRWQRSRSTLSASLTMRPTQTTVGTAERVGASLSTLSSAVCRPVPAGLPGLMAVAAQVYPDCPAGTCSVLSSNREFTAHSRIQAEQGRREAPVRVMVPSGLATMELSRRSGLLARTEGFTESLRHRRCWG